MLDTILELHCAPITPRLGEVAKNLVSIYGSLLLHDCPVLMRGLLIER
jgi:hypothetical protein